MKVALITDTHWGARSDSPVFRLFFEKFYSEIFFPCLKERKISTVIHLGDVVDRRKYINFVTLNRFRECFLRPLYEMDIDTHIIVGNHDVPYRNSNAINAMSELVGNEFPNIKHYSEATDLHLPDATIALVPWINAENFRSTMEFCDNTSAEAMLGHLEIKGFQMYRGLVSDVGFDGDLFSKFKIVCIGHFHHKSSYGNIHYLGNPYEITWHDYDDQRGFHIFDTETLELEFIPNPFSIFHKIIYDDYGKSFEEITQVDLSVYKDNIVKVILVNKTDPYAFDVFLDNLYKVGPADISIVDDHKNMDLLTEEEITADSEDTMQFLTNYIDNLNTNVSKTTLKNLISNLYNEAQQGDI